MNNEVQGQCNAQSSSARVSRQDTSQEPQEHNAVRGPAQAPSGTAVQKNMARFGCCSKDASQLFQQQPSSVPHTVVLLLIQINLNLIYSSFYRCFPGLFKDKQKCRPPSRLSKKRSGTKTTPIQFFLLDSPTERTPKPSDELMLLQAGLGRRTVNVPEDACHNEVCGMTLDEVRTEIFTKYY